uniref:Endonuclease/exonuclease/phosphatase domain-containing protein n=1 Tax=Triticum urartu TaxID=4572 RepID=A0A8R7V8Z6_TRIUA
MAAFRDALAVCELRDIGFTGYPYTFDNHQQGNRNVRVRLDRVCADDDWMARFPNAELHHLTSSRSDHCPLLLRLQQPDPRPRNRARRYEIMWEREETLPEIIVNSWEKVKVAGDLGVVAKSL